MSVTRSRYPTAASAAPACLLGAALMAVVLPFEARAADSAAEADSNNPTITVNGRRGDENPNADAKAPYKVDRSQNDKFTEKLRDTPKTVVAIPKEAIEDMGANSFREVVRSTPGVTLGTGEGGNAFGDRIFIRGFEARNDVYIDGLRDPGVTSREIFAVEQIEVIKGPSGQFGGRGTTGGLVSLESKRPNFLGNFLNVEQGIGTDNAYRTTLDVNRAITDRFVVRVNGLYHTADTPGRDYVYQNRYGGTIAAAWRATDRLTVSADYYFLRMDGLPDYGVPFDVSTQRPYKVAQGNFYGVIGRDFIKNGASIGTGRIDWTPVDGLKIRSVTRYGRTFNHYVVAAPGAVCRVQRVTLNGVSTCPAGGTLSPPTGGTVVPESQYTVNQGTQRRWSDNDYIANVTDATAQLETFGIGHTLVLGGEYSRERVRNYPLLVPASVEDASGNLITTGGLNTNLLNPTPVLGYTIPIAIDTATGPATTTVREMAAYAIDTIKFDKHWWLTLGARFDSYDIDFRPSNLATATVLRNSSSFWNGQASLLWKPVEPLSLYVSWATSSNPSGEQLDGSGNSYGGITAQTANLTPERNKSWEAGVKYEANGGDLLLTAAAFSITKDNAREQIADGTYQLVGKLRSRGFELGVSGELWDKLQLFGGYTYTDARIVESLATPANVGQRFPNIPAHSANLLATWNFTKTLEFGGQVHWQSAVYGGGVVAGTAHFPAYARFDMVGRAKITDRIEARLNINNVTNKLYYDAIYRSAAPFAYVAPGRSAMLTVKFSL